MRATRLQHAFITHFKQARYVSASRFIQRAAWWSMLLESTKSPSHGMPPLCLVFDTHRARSVPNALPDKDDPDLDIYGMQGVPTADAAEEPAATQAPYAAVEHQQPYQQQPYPYSQPHACVLPLFCRR